MPRRRYFTLDQANALLPQLRTRLTTLIQVVGQLKTLRDRIEAAGYSISPEVMEEDIEKAPVHVRRALAHFKGLYETMGDELRATERIGAQIKDLDQGLVDFFSIRDGKDDVLLCWRLGETRIEYWHEIDGGFQGRRPVTGHTFVADRRAERHAKP